MTKRVQLAGFTTETEQFLVGLERELRVDTDNDSLRLHDGVKEGGFEFLNRDANDGRYQAHSAELDGFSFGAQEKGILVRVGPASYKIRRVISNSGDITFVNPRGTAGDFDLRISDEVESAHTWNGVQTFALRIVAEDGVTGDTYGTHRGDVIGDVTGNLTGDADGNHTGSFTGDVDVRGKDFVTDDGQILETQIDPEAWIRRGVPIGAILLWSGSVATIPESWALCDGNNGTPDLTNSFILGAGTGTGIAPPNTTGGSDTVALTGSAASGGSHTHPLDIDPHALTIAEMPAHDHGDGVVNGTSVIFVTGRGTLAATAVKHVQESGGGAGVEGLTSQTGNGDPHTHTGNTTDSGAHTHSITLDDATIIPPYYALCYIMKTV